MVVAGFLFPPDGDDEACEQRILLPLGRMIAYCWSRLAHLVSSLLRLRSKSFLRTGSLAKRLHTFTVVPLLLAQVDSWTWPPWPKASTVARSLPSSLVVISTSPTVARDAKASPLNPSVSTFPSKTSFGSVSFDVVCRAHTSGLPSSSKRSERDIPRPSSETSRLVSPQSTMTCPEHNSRVLAPSSRRMLPPPSTIVTDRSIANPPPSPTPELPSNNDSRFPGRRFPAQNRKKKKGGRERASERRARERAGEGVSRSGSTLSTSVWRRQRRWPTRTRRRTR